MSDDRPNGTDATGPSAQHARGPDRPDRRHFFRSAAALAVGGLTSTPSLSQTDAASTAVIGDAARALEAQTARAMRWAGPPLGNWVRPRPGIDHSVVIVGAGHSGIA